MSCENIGVILKNDQNCMTMSFWLLENAEFEFHTLNNKLVSLQLYGTNKTMAVKQRSHCYHGEIAGCINETLSGYLTTYYAN